VALPPAIRRSAEGAPGTGAARAGAGAAPQCCRLVPGASAGRRRRAPRTGSRDTAQAALVVEQHVDGLILRSEGATLARWLTALPGQLTSSRPRLCLAQTFVAVAGSDLDAAEPSLDAAERAFAHAADEPFVGKAASLLANVPATIALERAVLAQSAPMASCSGGWSRPSGQNRAPRAASRSVIWVGWRAPSSRPPRSQDGTRPSARRCPPA
jgi:hypothetical protein